MIQTVMETPHFQWLNIMAPTPEELEKIGGAYGLHQLAVKDCLQPEHLPKHERVANVEFFILRAFDQDASEYAYSVRELTRKVAVFLSHNFLITIHRVDQTYLEELRKSWGHWVAESEHLGIEIVCDLMRAIVRTYEAPLNHSLETLEVFETTIFFGQASAVNLKELYRLKKRLSVYQRMLMLTKEILGALRENLKNYRPLLQDLQEELDQLNFLANQLSEDSQNLLNMHLSLASHRTSETMRVLTVFSVFFLPLTFIVGVYGMNFENMPELKWSLGYPMVWLVMIGVTCALLAWFKKNKLL